MTPAERIRVFIAGDIYPKRGLVRRFLEDDGYDVVGTSASRKAMVASIRASEPDAVVVDGDLLVAGAAGGTVARLMAIASGATLVVLGLIAMLARGGPTPPPVDRTEGGTGGDVVALDAMDDARATLRELIGALESGDYVLASLLAEELLDVRERAMEQGFSVSGLNVDITARLSAFVDLLPARVNLALLSILGSLYPDLSDEGTQGGGGLVEGPNLMGGNDAGDTDNGGGRGDDGDTDNGGGGGGVGGGDGDDGDADNDGGGGGGGGGGDDDGDNDDGGGGGDDDGDNDD